MVKIIKEVLLNRERRYLSNQKKKININDFYYGDKTVSSPYDCDFHRRKTPSDRGIRFTDCKTEHKFSTMADIEGRYEISVNAKKESEGIKWKVPEIEEREPLTKKIVDSQGEVEVQESPEEINLVGSDQSNSKQPVLNEKTDKSTKKNQIELLIEDGFKKESLLSYTYDTSESKPEKRFAKSVNDAILTDNKTRTYNQLLGDMRYFIKKQQWPIDYYGGMKSSNNLEITKEEKTKSIKTGETGLESIKIGETELESIKTGKIELIVDHTN